MEDISTLIREARPLYLARKRRRRVGLFGAVTALCIICMQLPFGATDTLPIYDAWTDEINLTQNGSPIEDMGLPVDEYGLLMVG